MLMPYGGLLNTSQTLFMAHSSGVYRALIIRYFFMIYLEILEAKVKWYHLTIKTSRTWCQLATLTTIAPIIASDTPIDFLMVNGSFKNALALLSLALVIKTGVSITFIAR